MKPQDGTGISYKTLRNFLNDLIVDLDNAGEDTHYFDMIVDFLEKDVANGKPFIYNSRVLGL